MARKTSRKKSTRRAGHGVLFPNSLHRWFRRKSASDQAAQQQGATQQPGATQGEILLEVCERLASDALKIARNDLGHAEYHEEYGRLSEAWSDALHAKGWIGHAIGAIMLAEHFKHFGGHIVLSKKLESITGGINDVALSLWHLTNRLREKTFGGQPRASEDED
jgi:hypothetical protein